LDRKILVKQSQFRGLELGGSFRTARSGNDVGWKTRRSLRSGSVGFVGTNDRNLKG